uniref:Rho guanyl-nucleotide exchange factor 12 n=1 Tax=Tanacetum cinerariifolium TaxID=118510 RepID=A0A6L2MEQ6_TANCI|nr:Rho guanyl-nucleotide exchange factor 12 [Tanacetum cinerariifolium]
MITTEDAMPWVGLYVAGASLACTLAMAADAFQGFRHWKLWFPNKFFVLNTVSITLIAIAMKLPVDLTTNMSKNNAGDWNGKIVSIAFLVTMLYNFLPSLGLMDDKELLVNMVAWSILLITITVNVSFQVFAGMLPAVLFLLLLFPILWVFSIAVTVPASRRILEHRYKELHGSVSYPIEIKFSYEELEHNVKKYWMMAETGNPQFAIACSEVASTFEFIGSLIFLSSLVQLFRFDFPTKYSDYNWSLKLIVGIQSSGACIVSYCWYFFKMVIRFRKEENVSNRNVRSEMKEYAKYVLQIEDDAKLSEKISRNALKSINQLLLKSEKNEPDILCACFTNLPCVIKKMCHHDAIEKREDSVRSAAQLLGRSRKILEILNTRQLPNLDVDSMADIGMWHALPKREIPNGAPLNQSQLAFPSSNESVIVNIGV